MRKSGLTFEIPITFSRISTSKTGVLIKTNLKLTPIRIDQDPISTDTITYKKVTHLSSPACSTVKTNQCGQPPTSMWKGWLPNGSPTKEMIWVSWICLMIFRSSRDPLMAGLPFYIWHRMFTDCAFSWRDILRSEHEGEPLRPGPRASIDCVMASS